MSELERLYDEKRKYTILKNRISTIINYLNNSIEALKTAVTTIDNTFKIDGEQADNKELFKLRESLKNKRDYLKNTVYPSINSKLNNLNQKIVTEESTPTV